MAKTDWETIGVGELSIIEESGSKRLHILGPKILLYNGRDDLVDCRIEFDIRFDSAAAGAWAGIVLRSDVTRENCYFIYFIKDTPTTRTIRIRCITPSGGETVAETIVPFDFSEYSRWQFQIEGDIISIKRWVDSEWEPIIVAEDDTHSSGYVGLENGPGVTRYCRFDNIEISEKT